MTRKSITNELIKKLYIDCNMSMRQIAIKLGVCYAFISRRIHALGLVKTSQQITKSRVSNTQAYYDSLRQRTHLGKAKASDIQKYYIEENHTHKETCRHFGLTSYGLDKLLKLYGIHKSKHDSAQRALITKYKKYGSKAAYDKHINECIRTVHITKHGSITKYREWLSATLKSSWASKTAHERQLHAQKAKAAGAGWNHSKIACTIRQKYNVDNISQLPEIKAKIRQTLADTAMARYGVSNVFAIPSVREKRLETIRQRYGAEHPSQSPIIKSKTRATCLKRYGRPYAWNYKTVSRNNLDKHGIAWNCLKPECINSIGNKGKDTKPNLEFKKLLDEHGIRYTREYVIDNRSYDFKIDNKLVEIDPFATHNSTWGLFGKGGLAKDYHYNKSQQARINGYRCIHVWDWDNIDKILALLSPTTAHIGARKCTVREVDRAAAKRFIDTYHLQGYVSDQVRLGLYYNGVLVSIMTFGRPRYNKKYEYELIRFCSGMRITGGAEKLFSYFIAKYNPKSIISYCDYSKFTGTTYTKLGMVFSNVAVARHWYNPSTGSHITDNLLRKHGFDRLLGKVYGCYGKGTNNDSLMLKHGYVEIYDAGQAVYVWDYRMANKKYKEVEGE